MMAAQPSSHAARQPWWTRLHHWITQRSQTSSTDGSMLLNYRNLYVLPSAAGCMLAATLLVLLLASINFQLNLGYLLTFLLAGSAFASLWSGHRNLRGLRLQAAETAPLFLGDTASVTLQLQSPPQRRTPCHAMALAWQQPARPRQWVHVDVPAQAQQTVTLRFIPMHRGWQHIPRIVLETRYPLGVFRIWSYWQPHAQVLVYPAPETPCPPIRHSDELQPGRTTPQLSGPSDLDDVRLYRRGDALRTVLWKKAATAMARGSDELVVRSGRTHQSLCLWLDARATGLSAVEAQIARLTAWVLHAHTQQWEWGLRLPSGLCLPPASGYAHLQECLTALATDSLPITHKNRGKS